MSGVPSHKPLWEATKLHKKHPIFLRYVIEAKLFKFHMWLSGNFGLPEYIQNMTRS